MHMQMCVFMFLYEFMFVHVCAGVSAQSTKKTMLKLTDLTYLCCDMQIRIFICEDIGVNYAFVRHH